MNQGDNCKIVPLSKIEPEKYSLKAVLKHTNPTLVPCEKKFKLLEEEEVEKSLIKYEMEQTIKRFKFGIMFVRKGQSTEEEMFNNGMYNYDILRREVYSKCYNCISSN